MLISVYEYDGVPFERIEGKWICKGIAMKGPTGSMLGKEVPEVYAKEIEKAYQTSLNSKERNPKLKLIGRRNENSDQVDEIDPMEKKIEKLKKKLEQQAEKKTQALEKTIKTTENPKKKVKSKLVGGFNPFAK